MVIPVFNEEENILHIVESLEPVLGSCGRNYEIIFVDDGSWDNTFKNLMSIKDKHLKIIKLRTHFGQSAAFDAGLKSAKGSIIVTMDGDLQNDPKDIPKLLAKLKEGFDVVSGWRHKRKDPVLKRIASRIAYLIRKRFIKDKTHDYGCSLKAYKREALEDIDLSGELHRYIVALCAIRGFKIGEVKVSHRPRNHGKTKYKSTRLIKGFLDLFLIIFWMKYAKRPIHLFGGLGIVLSAIGGFMTIYLITERLVFGHSLANRPLFILGIFVLLMGIQFFVSGILADIAVKNYYKSSGKTNYSIEKIIGK
ncbi:MAG: glycosyltransferase family 2 protein [Nanoarchaeota archaeon]|nr:glycosyltransferase family 2 protein [Nanoarchaeota archaeon]